VGSGALLAFRWVEPPGGFRCGCRYRWAAGHSAYGTLSAIGRRPPAGSLMTLKEEETRAD
jgi:hypothetical protein